VIHENDPHGRPQVRQARRGYAGSRYGGRASRAAWHCRCDCGSDTIKIAAHLREREGSAQSYGCINKARFKKREDRR
jgi:hypothetical protein